jgi:hypothetical protein
MFGDIRSVDFLSINSNDFRCLLVDSGDIEKSFDANGDGSQDLSIQGFGAR